MSNMSKTCVGATQECISQHGVTACVKQGDTAPDRSKRNASGHTQQPQVIPMQPEARTGCYNEVQWSHDCSELHDMQPNASPTDKKRNHPVVKGKQGGSFKHLPIEPLLAKLPAVVWWAKRRDLSMTCGGLVNT
eukprot:1140878-Pelagomonas_calceolata.AAC.9